MVLVDIAREGWEIDLDQSGNFAIEENGIDTENVRCLLVSGQFDFKAAEVFFQTYFRDGSRHH